MTVKMPQFVRELKRFREVAAAGESIVVEDQAGPRFIFALAPQTQHPPRQADRGLDPKQFADIDLDEPAVPSCSTQIAGFAPCQDFASDIFEISPASR